MILILFLILFPLLAAVLMPLIKNEKARGAIVIASAAVIIVASVLTAIKYFGSGLILFEVNIESLNMIILALEVILAAGLFYLGIRHKKYLASVLALIQVGLIAWFELGTGGDLHATHNLYIDNLSLIMVLIIGIIGGLITIYAVGYMRDYQKHAEGKDRRSWFFLLMFVFLSAMFGIVLSNNLMWMLFFWEITTVCSFLLIGFTKTEEATNNSFRALIMNLIGGIGFAVAIIIMGREHGIIEMDVLLESGAAGVAMMLPLCLLVFAGIVKAAQMPFHTWLLGAMVAPTPTSALLHSSTMVKAGVFLVIKLSPLLGLNEAGYLAMLIGGMTFLLASMAAISQSNAKRVLAYSTIANLGLIIACAGVGTPDAVWAAIMLTIFHAVTKSLLFLCVGTAEHNVGSRDIEDMDGLFSKMPRLASLMIVGIVAMFLAPFGVLVSKWSAMAAFVDTQSLILLICVCFGSAVTMFYWGKWLGKMVAVVAGKENIEAPVHKHEWFATGTHAILVIGLCLFLPLLSLYVVIPTLEGMFGTGTEMTFSHLNLFIMSLMMLVIMILPIFFFRKKRMGTKPTYMCGVNTGDNMTYLGSMGNNVNVSFRNWYMKDWFGEERISKIGTIIAAVTMVMLMLYSVLSYTGVV